MAFKSFSVVHISVVGYKLSYPIGKRIQTALFCPVSDLSPQPSTDSPQRRVDVTVTPHLNIMSSENDDDLPLKYPYAWSPDSGLALQDFLNKVRLVTSFLSLIPKSPNAL